MNTNKVLFHYIIHFYIHFSDGSLVLELNHQKNTDGHDHWAPSTKRTWIPPGPIKAESSPSIHSGKPIKMLHFDFIHFQKDSYFCIAFKD